MFLRFRCRRGHGDEAALQRALVGEVRYQRRPEEMKAILQAVGARPNIDAQRVKDLLYVMAATADGRG